MAAGLFLVLALNLYLLADGFAVCYARLFKTKVNAEFGFQLADNNVKVLLAQTGEYLLFGFGVHLKIKGCVLFHKTGNGGSGLAVVALAFGICSHSEARSRELCLFEGNNAFGVAKGVAGGGFRKLGDGAYVARGNGVNRLLNLAVHKNKLAKALLASGSGINGG